MAHPDVLTLKRIPMDSVTLNQHGDTWARAGIAVYEDRIRKFYGNIPQPLAAIEDDLTLCFFWECGGDPIVVRMDSESWDYVKDPLIERDNDETN